MNRDQEIASPNDDTPLYQAVIGRSNTDYYLAYFRRADARGYAPISWHWPALFLGLFWLLYRRLYRWGLIFSGVSVGLTMLASTLLVAGGGPWVTRVYYVVMLLFQVVYVPLNANAIYYRWAKQEIANARAASPHQPRQQVLYLTMRGGVLKNLPVMVAAVLVLLMTISQALQSTDSQ